MYVPASFAESEDNRLWRLVRDWPFATLISSTGEVPWVSHLPLVADEDRRVLRGHMAKANPHWRALDAGDSLAIFHGPHHYVSPSWYANQPSVPTWNYAVVHAEGKARAVHDPRWIETLLEELVQSMERGALAWRIARLPRDYLDAMVAGVVGFEMEISKLAGKFKLSQNRPAEDRPRVIRALEQIGTDAARDTAELMRSVLSDPDL